MLSADTLAERLAEAVSCFWKTRSVQVVRQEQRGRHDQGSRGAVTGGKHMDGFVRLVRDVILAAGLPDECVFTSKKVELPGYFRAEKKWDLVVVDSGVLVAAIEFKPHVGSIANNFNNRSEEAIGAAQDIWTAYREGAFQSSRRPWLGYVMMLEDCPQSRTSVAVREPHFKVFPEFAGASYSERYRLLLTRLIRERLYDSACFVMSSQESGQKGCYTEPDRDLSFIQMVSSLSGRIMGHLMSGRG